MKIGENATVIDGLAIGYKTEGGKDKINYLIRLLTPTVRAAVRRACRTNKNADEEDYMQKGFLKVIELTHTFELGRGRFQDLVYRATFNSTISELRKTKNNRYIHMGDDIKEEPIGAKFFDNHSKAITALEKLEELPVREKFVIKQTLLSGKTLEEISEELGVSFQMVHKIRNNGLKRLREMLK